MGLYNLYILSYLSIIYYHMQQTYCQCLIAVVEDTDMHPRPIFHRKYCKAGYDGPSSPNSRSQDNHQSPYHGNNGNKVICCLDANFRIQNQDDHSIWWWNCKIFFYLFPSSTTNHHLRYNNTDYEWTTSSKSQIIVKNQTMRIRLSAA